MGSGRSTPSQRKYKGVCYKPSASRPTRNSSKVKQPAPSNYSAHPGRVISVKGLLRGDRSDLTLYDGPTEMHQKQSLLHHFLAALAYRTQKELRGAPAEFASFRAGSKIRTPYELIRHMDDVLGYSRTFFIGGSYRSPEFL